MPGGHVPRYTSGETRRLFQSVEEGEPGGQQAVARGGGIWHEAASSYGSKKRTTCIIINRQKGNCQAI